MKTTLRTKRLKLNPSQVERLEQVLFASIALTAWITILSLLAGVATATASWKDRYALIGLTFGTLSAVLCAFWHTQRRAVCL